MPEGMPNHYRISQYVRCIDGESDIVMRAIVDMRRRPSCISLRSAGKVEECRFSLAETTVEVDHRERPQVEGVISALGFEIDKGVWTICQREYALCEIQHSECSIGLAIGPDSHL